MRCRNPVLDNTLVIFIMGDNGASAEGTMQGTTNEVATAANGVQESLPYLLSMMDQLGGPLTYNHYPVGWAHAMDAPMQWTTQVASHFGKRVTKYISPSQPPMTQNAIGGKDQWGDWDRRRRHGRGRCVACWHGGTAAG
jgi:arylsulfatase A-like enzyme